MYIEQNIKSNSTALLQSQFAEFNQHTKIFQNIFERTVNQRSNSRPPKLELRGILIPLQVEKSDHNCFYKIETDQNEYLLRMSNSNLSIAKKIEWEEVLIKGYLDLDENIFEVEKIAISKRNEPYRLSLGPTDFYFELDQYKKSIDRKGKLDVSPDYLAS